MTTDTLKQMTEKFNHLQYQISNLEEERKSLREEIIATMNAQLLKKFTTKTEKLLLMLSLSVPKSFDEKSFRSENAEVSKKYITTKQITETVEEFDKKRLEKEEKGLYQKYLVEGTPRLTLKSELLEGVME